MRLRCIAFLPPAAIMTGLIFLLTSSIVSALESKFARSDRVDRFEIVRHESQCEFLERRLDEVARDVHSCEALPGCLHSTKLCPERILDELSDDYDRLRFALRDECPGSASQVARVSLTCSTDARDCTLGHCDASGTAVSFERELKTTRLPSTFVF